jgi:hypothetical protein
MAMDKQMEMFEDGGLMDEGGMVDEVSGNEVPPGSTREEVRDDIPAQLSEGEFVFPADVVRYIGLENLMRMRQEAKIGLAQMDAMGQMGNSEEATMPDDLPFDMYDLDVEDDGVQEFAQGGVIKAQAGTFVTPGTAGLMGTQQSQFANYTSGLQPVQPVTPVMPTTTVGQYTPPIQQYTPVTTTQVSGMSPGGAGAFDVGPPDEYKTYRNEAGVEIQVPFKNGKVHPTFTVPEGYKAVSEAEKTKAPETSVGGGGVGDAGVSQDSEYSDDDPAPKDPFKGEFTTTDMRGVGYDKSKIDNEELENQLDKIAKAQVKELASGTPSGMTAKVASTLKSGGVNTNKEFLHSQKVTMDAYLAGLDGLYGKSKDAFVSGEGMATQRLHELAPGVKRALAGELSAVEAELTKAVAGKSAEDLAAELADTTKGLGKDIADLGLDRTIEDPRYGEREKSYGQMFAEARATKNARDKLASQYGLDANGKSLSQIKREAKAAQDRIDAQARANREAALANQQAQMGSTASVSEGGGTSYGSEGSRPSFGGSVGYGGGVGTGGGVGQSFGSYGGFNKGGLAKQMEKSGLTPKK